jgi:hypothetical protein
MNAPYRIHIPNASRTFTRREPKMANEELHRARALLLRALGQQHVRALHCKVVAIGVSAHCFFRSAVYVADSGAVVSAYVRVGAAGGG